MCLAHCPGSAGRRGEVKEAEQGGEDTGSWGQTLSGGVGPGEGSGLCYE